MSVSWINEFFGQTPNASEHGGLVDHMLGFVHWFMLALFIGWSIYLVLAFYRFNAKRNAKGDYHGVTGHATTHIEIGVVIVESCFSRHHQDACAWREVPLELPIPRQ